MSKQVILSMLAQSNNGNELLQILDSLTDNDQQSDDNGPTLNEIEF